MQIPCLMSVVAMLCVTRGPQWVVLNDSWCHRITQLNEELLSARRLGVASAVYAPLGGCWLMGVVFQTRTRERPSKGDPAKKVGWSKTEPLCQKIQWVGRTLGFEVFKTTKSNWTNMTAMMVT